MKWNIKATVFFLVFVSVNAFATTWNEPWQDKIIKESQSFVLAKVMHSSPKSLKIEIIKTLGGIVLSGEIEITGYYLLNICSSSSFSDETGFDFGETKECYFFIKKNDKEQYCISTPSSGYAARDEGKVIATYRHSYHQALVPYEVYEKTMTAIFNNYHNQAYDKTYVTDYIEKYLSIKPAILNEAELDMVFMQHVALECIYHLRLPGYYDKIVPFLDQKQNFHGQLSAAQALMPYNTKQCQEKLLQFIGGSENNNFVKVLCIRTLAGFKPKKLKKQLEELAKKVSDEETGFGGNIMDPRICTNVPDVKSSIESLLENL